MIFSGKPTFSEIPVVYSFCMFCIFIPSETFAPGLPGCFGLQIYMLYHQRKFNGETSGSRSFNTTTSHHITHITHHISPHNSHPASHITRISHSTHHSHDSHLTPHITHITHITHRSHHLHLTSHLTTSLTSPFSFCDVGVSLFVASAAFGDVAGSRFLRLWI